MKKSVKIWLITAFSLILVGAMIFGGALAVLKWDLSGFWKNSFEKEEYVFTEAVKSISVSVKEAKVEIVSTTASAVSVKTNEHKNAKHTVTLTDGVLSIEVDDQRAWYEHIFSFGSPTVTVELPEGVYGDLRVEAKTGDVTVDKGLTFGNVAVSVRTGDIKCLASARGDASLKASTGDIEVKNAAFGVLSLSVSTGDIELENVRAAAVTVASGTGDVALKNTLLSGALHVDVGTGNVSFEDFDAAEIFVKTRTGDVKGSILSEKVFIASARTGKKDVPKTTSGGRCEITTGTGDIIITVK